VTGLTKEIEKTAFDLVNVDMYMYIMCIYMRLYILATLLTRSTASAEGAVFNIIV